MRLGQLARKLALRQTEIVEFLALNNIQIEDGVNTRLENDHVTMIMQKFAPDKIEVVSVVESSGNSEINVAEESTTTETSIQASESIPEVIAEAKTDNEAAEIIKAPKIELTGLKVLGKIDLPEPKKKEVQPELIAQVPDTETVEVEKKPRPEFKKQKDQKFQRSGHRQEKNPIALQREREAREAQKKREEQAEREKEKRTQNYLKKVKMSPPTKAVRMVEEPLMEMSAQELEEGPKTVWGKFVKWLTT